MANSEEQKVEAPSYEELKKQVMQLAENCDNLYNQLQKANLFNAFKRLEFCFKVVENSKEFNTEFVEYCKNDITQMMTLKDSKNKE